MAMKRRAARGPSRRPKKIRRVARKSTLTRMVRDNVVFFKRRFRIGQYDCSSNWNGVNYSFTLGSLPNYTEITNLFEQYKINAVKLTFIPNYFDNDAAQTEFNISQNAVIAAIGGPRVYTLIDKDGSPQSGSESTMLENSAARIIRKPFQGFQIYINKPAVQVEVATSLGFSNAMPKASPWLDCDNYSVRHEGCAVGSIMSFTSDGGLLRYQVIATYYIAAKGVK